MQKESQQVYTVDGEHLPWALLQNVLGDQVSPPCLELPVLPCERNESYILMNIKSFVFQQIYLNPEWK